MDKRNLIRLNTAQDESGCWNWARFKSKDGYGRYRGAMAHRISFEAFVGPLVPGMHIDHTCWNRACCNPEHLRQVSAAENLRRQRSALKTHCIRGHLLSGSNVYDKKADGRRQCRACNLIAVRKYKQRNAA